MYYTELEKENCPVCIAKFQKVGMRNHIYGKAKAELFEYWIGEIEETPHKDYLEKRLKVKVVRRISLEE